MFLDNGYHLAKNESLYCSYCLAFEPPDTPNISGFATGFTDYRRVSDLWSMSPVVLTVDTFKITFAL